MQVRGIIFDFNGVLVDDEPIHFYAFQRVLETENLQLTWEEYYEKYLPYDDRNFFLNFLRDRSEPSEPERLRRLIELKSRQYFDAVEKNVPVIQSSIDFVSQLPLELCLAIASGAAREEIEFILDRLQLRERFLAIVAAEDVMKGKPHPEGFLKAFEGLQFHQPDLKPAQVIGIEDSYRGIPAVHAAGMKCVALATTYPPRRLKKADLVVESFDGWTLQRLAEALAKPQENRVP